MRLPSVSDSLWIKGVITWLAYSLTGLAALSVVVPGTPLSQMYLAAGVALGLVLGWGPKVLWGVAMGGFTVMLVGQAPLYASVGWTTILTQCLATASGAALQAWAGYRLTLGSAQPDFELDRPGPIARFFLLAGPVACLINPMVSVSAMTALGIIPGSSALKFMLSWWGGDIIGVMVGVPIVLTLVGRPAELWQARRRVVGIPLAVSMLLLALAICQVQDWDNERETAFFEHDVIATQDEIELKLNGYVHAIEALHGVYEASNHVTRQEFAAATRYWLDNLSGIQALGWEERVLKNELPDFEARQRAEGLSGYHVFDRDEYTDERRPTQAKEVVAIRFIEPMRGNEQALGLNILSMAPTRKAYEQALATGRATVTAGLRLTQESGKQTGVVVYRPVYEHTETSKVKGTVFITLRMDDTLKAVLRDLPAYLNVCLQEGPVTQSRFLGGGEECRQPDWTPPTSYHRTVPLSFAGAQWQLTVWAKQPIPVVGRSVTSWVLSVGGAAFATALCIMLLVMSGHTRKVEAAMKEASEQRQVAETANRAKSEFLSRMSHELRTPLNAVLGFAQVMDIDTQTPLPPTQHQRLLQIQQAGWHLLDMIDDVLDISRLETGTLRLTTEPVPIGPAIHQVCMQVTKQAANLGIELLWPQDVPRDWGVQADPGRLRQILQTLLDNGITYNERQGSVTVSVSRHQAANASASIVITVKDTGMGMSAEQVSQLFQPFNRLGRDKNMPDGAGVGLAIGRHLATLMGGQLEADSREGQGATFTLTLPAAHIDMPVAANDEPGNADQPLSVSPESPQHVLYVEDNLVNSEVVRAALEDRPWIHLTVTPTIEEGLSVLHNRLQGPKPDLILLDVHLPDASGQEFLRLVKANPETSHIPVIMISADAMPEQIESALSAGAACYLTKPVQLGELLNQVDMLLNRPPEAA